VFKVTYNRSKLFQRKLDKEQNLKKVWGADLGKFPAGLTRGGGGGLGKKI